MSSTCVFAGDSLIISVGMRFLFLRARLLLRMSRSLIRGQERWKCELKVWPCPHCCSNQVIGATGRAARLSVRHVVFAKMGDWLLECSST
eukprot:1168842-Amphidinium_carterae.1